MFTIASAEGCGKCEHVKDVLLQKGQVTVFCLVQRKTFPKGLCYCDYEDVRWKWLQGTC